MLEVAMGAVFQKTQKPHWSKRMEDPLSRTSYKGKEQPQNQKNRNTSSYKFLLPLVLGLDPISKSGMRVPVLVPVPKFVRNIFLENWWYLMVVLSMVLHIVPYLGVYWRLMPNLEGLWRPDMTSFLLLIRWYQLMWIGNPPWEGSLWITWCI